MHDAHTHVCQASEDFQELLDSYMDPIHLSSEFSVFFGVVLLVFSTCLSCYLKDSDRYYDADLL